MSTVIETLGKYEHYLTAERLVSKATLRKVRLSLSYFCELFGNTDTKDLRATDMHTFFQRIKLKRTSKSKASEEKPFGSAHVNKIMTHLKAYVKRLSDNAKLWHLLPHDVPNCKVTEARIAYLSKEELGLIFRFLEKDILDANMSGNEHRIYSVYLWRAVVRMLYTSWRRNFELR